MSNLAPPGKSRAVNPLADKAPPAASGLDPNNADPPPAPPLPDAATGAGPASPVGSRVDGRRWLVRAGLLVLTAAAFGPMVADAGLTVWSGALALGLAFAPVAVGVYLTFRLLNFPDLTVDASFAGGAAASSLVVVGGAWPWFSLPVAFVVGALLGLLTGLFHIVLRINSLLASILTVTAAFTLNLRLQGQANVSLLGETTVFSGLKATLLDAMESAFGQSGVESHRNATTIVIALVVLIVLLVALIAFLRTEVGIALRATGANPAMSRAQGIDTRLYLIGGVALSNGLIGISGALVSQHQGFADVNSGAGLIIAGLAAVIIGEVLFGRGSRSLARILVAVALGTIVYRAAIAITLSGSIDLPLLPAVRLQATDVRLATTVVVVALLLVPRLRQGSARTKGATR